MVSTSFLRVHWISGDYKGAIDYLPWSWFSREGTASDLTHEFLGTDGIIRSARCSVMVRGNSAILDYGGKYSQKNLRNYCEPGLLKIIFKSSTRKVPDELWWAEDRGDFKLGFAVAGMREEDIEAEEGEPKFVAHLRRERAPKLRERKIKQVLGESRELRCEACNFSFRDQYGSLAGNFCEVHHRKGLAASGPTGTRLKDLAVLCSNCHRMIHRTNPMMSVEQFAKRVVQERFNLSRPGQRAGRVAL